MYPRPPSDSIYPSPPCPQRSGGVAPTTPGCADPHHPALDNHPVGEGQRSTDTMCSLLRRHPLCNVDRRQRRQYISIVLSRRRPPHRQCPYLIPLTYSVDAAYEQSLEDEAFPSIPASCARPIVPSPKVGRDGEGSGETTRLDSSHGLSADTTANSICSVDR
ncbi:hypothetical protein C8J57DRAFT_1640134 [Mycena rebaudengoi]|nr:hypothetical protein C8J57DRAFT_1640134 [Mycena rebaudengoi]